MNPVGVARMVLVFQSPMSAIPLTPNVRMRMTKMSRKDATYFQTQIVNHGMVKDTYSVTTMTPYAPYLYIRLLIVENVKSQMNGGVMMDNVLTKIGGKNVKMAVMKTLTMTLMMTLTMMKVQPRNLIPMKSF